MAGMYTQRLSAEEAAPILGITPTRIRNRMLRDYLQGTKDFPVGHVHRASSGTTFRYDLYKPMIMKYMGWEEWPE